ncbi:hypothetical protein APA_2473 [Pseudanabaena sp. lw0831]|nr:hypothetical protein APA_2473 [Pseudanabaena sp. lw0831]
MIHKHRDRLSPPTNPITYLPQHQTAIAKFDIDRDRIPF